MTNPTPLTVDHLSTMDIRSLRTLARQLGVTLGKRYGTKAGVISALVDWAATHAPLEADAPQVDPEPEAAPVAPEAPTEAPAVDWANDGATEPPAPITHGSRLVIALERLYDAMRARHTDLPELLIRTGSGVSRTTVTWGHYAPGAWLKARDEGRLPEMFISGECIARGAVGVLVVMLHESAHGLADVWGIKDTSRGGAWHNREFVAIAEKLGLAWPTDDNGKAMPACPKRGFSAVVLPESTEADYMLELVELDSAIHASMDTLAGLGNGGDLDPRVGGHGVTPPKAPRDPNAPKRSTAKLVCQCAKPRILRVAWKEAELGDIHCGQCSSPFALEGGE